MSYYAVGYYLTYHVRLGDTNWVIISFQQSSGRLLSSQSPKELKTTQKKACRIRFRIVFNSKKDPRHPKRIVFNSKSDAVTKKWSCFQFLEEKSGKTIPSCFQLFRPSLMVRQVWLSQSMARKFGCHSLVF